MKTKFCTLFVALVATAAIWASNVITYKATEKLSETNISYNYGLHTNAFNVTIISHDFSNGIGTITFAGDVTTIGYDAFYFCDGLTSITIPNSVTTIENSAFENCNSLTSVTIPNSVTTIGGYAFSWCSSLTLITIPNSVTLIGSNAFYYCSSLIKTNYTGTVTDWCKVKFGNNVSNPIYYSHNFFINDVEIKDLVIPKGVNTIGNYAFCNCSSLTSVTIPNSVTTIGWGAFRGCTSLPVVDNLRYADTYLVEAVDKTLSTYTIKEGTKWIGEDAFYDCSNLTSINIPNSVTTIGDDAFGDCNSLTSITIPNSVTTIGGYAFGGSKLRDVSVAWTSSDQLPTMEDEVFDDIADGDGPSAATLHVPSGTKSIYENADQWKNFGSIIDNITALPYAAMHDARDTKHKVLRNGQILLDCNNATYTLMGQKVK